MTHPYPPLRNQLCCDCRYWCSYDKTTDQGLCRRHAPKPPLTWLYNQDALVTKWPLVFGDEWCGEWATQEASE